MNPVPSPFHLPGWLEFNAWRSRVTPHPITIAETDHGPEIRAVLYLDGRGRVKLPIGNAYLPVAFHSPRQHPSGRTSDWHRVAAPLVDEMRRRGSANQLFLSPDVDDVRPWLWRGFFVTVRYTYYIDFPFDIAGADRTTRRSVDHATHLGMTVDRVLDPEPVLACLADSEQRQGFVYGLRPRELREARVLLGDDHLRMYVCFDLAGAPAATLVVLHAPGARAMGWLGGTTAAARNVGANQMVWRACLADLEASGAIGIDLCGANIPSVAASKSHWGSRLVGNYGVRTYSPRTAARFAADWLSARGRSA